MTDYYKKLNARLDELLGARYYTQTRGGFTLCVRVPPGEQDEFERTPSKSYPNGFAYVSALTALEIGFFGTPIPDYCQDPMAMSPLIDAYAIELSPFFGGDGSVQSWDAYIYGYNPERGEAVMLIDQSHRKRFPAAVRVLIEHLGGQVCDLV